MKINKATRVLACLSLACHLVSSQALAASNTFPADGNVGVGTTSPISVFHIKDNAPTIILEDANAPGVPTSTISGAGGSVKINADSGKDAASSSIDLFVDDSRAVTIDSSGNVGIGAPPRFNAELEVTASNGPQLSVYDTAAHSGTGGGEVIVGAIDGGGPMTTSQELGKITFQGARDAASMGTGARILAKADQNWSSTDYGARLEFQTHFNATNTLTTAMTIDDSGNVGIGTTAPSSKLAIQNNSGQLKLQTSSNSTNYYSIIEANYNNGHPFGLKVSNAGNGEKEIIGAYWDGGTETDVVFNAGNVGIGTTAPSSKLAIQNNSGQLKLQTSSDSTNYYSIIEANYNNGHPFGLKVSNAGNGEKEIMGAYWDGGTETDVVFNAGNVGIGTINPQEKLSVNGTILAKEIKVSIASSDWSDYVFEDTYKLPPLDSVESYIKENKHLPDMPSAADIGQQGLAVSEMLALQMKKIEELTLYIIELEKRIGTSKNEQPLRQTAKCELN